eukprot:CAMPEP_0113844088 /NCGR_PEP_ID=MMETSP0372-20130328/60_1 /TAXON_ID=340204 /ORGANISM="Lankesteria abbotti" /LENGTH=520 /DNA_ID=CAMNT_0000813087 /DNA_START=288 /DNA_END=1850 /DNA_ORIENTATION=- /assembly_acc=CAM_ASM_000359
MDGFREEMGIPVLVEGIQQSAATSNKITYFSVFFHVFTLLGAPCSGTVADRFGRKIVILIACTLFFMGALWQCLAGLAGNDAWPQVILGRCLGGIGNGFMLTIMPIYACELSPPRFRGQVVTFFQLFITLGILIMAGINKGIQPTKWGWRLGISIQMIPCLIIWLLTFFILPESPRYLISRERFDDCEVAMVKLAKGSRDPELCVKFETAEMKEEVEKEKAVGKGSFIELFKHAAWPALMCGFSVAFCQNVTGVNWLMNYATSLFNSLGLDSFTYDLILKAINCIFTIASLFVVERLGRKWLTVWGTIWIIIVFIIIGSVIEGTGTDITAPNPDGQTKNVQYFVVIFLFIFQALFAITWGPAGWLVPGEVFPMRLRGVGMSSCVVANMITNIALGDYGYQQMSVSPIDIVGTIWVVVALNIVLVLPTVVILQPETKSVTMEEMRYVFGYEANGNPEHGHGTIGEFFWRNAEQTKQIVTCRKIDLTMGFERFDNVVHHNYDLEDGAVKDASSDKSSKVFVG